VGYGLGLDVGDGGVGEADDIGRGDPQQQGGVAAASPGDRKTEDGSIDDHRERGLVTDRGNSTSRMTGHPADGYGGGEHESTEAGRCREFPTVNPDRTGGDRREVGPVVVSKTSVFRIEDSGTPSAAAAADTVGIATPGATNS
jgi:hypothetical protein